jgi:Ca2+:H+ antiporter
MYFSNNRAMKYFKSESPIAIALLILGLGFGLEHSAVAHGGVMLWGLLLAILAAIIGVAFRIAHHAEVLAIRFGEPYGTLILTLAAVSVEVVILVVLLQGAPNPTLARDTVFAAVMFDINGILGLAAIVGGLKHGSSKYNLDSANSFIAMLLVAIGIGMFMPDFVPESKWQIYSVFSIGIMAIMYLAFLRLQTVEHRQFFEYDTETEAEAHDGIHSPNALHIGVMLGAVALVGVLSEVLSVLLDAGLAGSTLPKAIPAVLVALISASPEILTALKAAQQDRMQTTVNIALGASLATVLLTLPVIEALALLSGERIEMALTPVQGGLLLLTFATVMNNLHDGETNAIEGISHFALFAAFIALVAIGVI